MSNTTKRRVGPKVTPTPARPKTPEAFVIPTQILVDTIKLVGSLPTSQGHQVYTQLQRLQPISEEDEPDDDEEDDED